MANTYVSTFDAASSNSKSCRSNTQSTPIPPVSLNTISTTLSDEMSMTLTALNKRQPQSEQTQQRYNKHRALSSYDR